MEEQEGEKWERTCSYGSLVQSQVFSTLKIFSYKILPPVPGSGGLCRAHGVHNSGFFKVKFYSCCKSAENSRRHSVPLGPVMTELLQNRTQGIPHTTSQKNHTILMGPASKRAKQAAIIHLLVSHFYRQRCCQIVYGFFFVVVVVLRKYPGHAGWKESQ